MFGLHDFWVAAAYGGCLLSTIVCVVYGILNWNRGEEPPRPEDAQWADKEDQLEQEL